jgi:5-methylcytosine-specific restriction enzyme A
MPHKPPKPCNKQGCGKLTHISYCDTHLKERKKAIYFAIDKNRESSTKRGYGSRWQKYRKIFLGSNPICTSCKADGVLKGAEVVDHIKPHKGNYELFWDMSNWQSLCVQCHNRKSSQEGAFNARP